MEFNVFEHFKGYQRTSHGPVTAEEQGTRFFLGGHMGERIGQRVDTLCRARWPVAAQLHRHRVRLRRGDARRQRDHRDEVLRGERGGSLRPGGGQGDQGRAQAGAGLHRRRAHAHLHAQGRLHPRRQHVREGHVVRPAPRRPRQGHGPAQRHQGHDAGELRQAHPRGQRHQRGDLQPVRVPRGLRRQGHDPDRGAGRGQAALARSHADAGRRAHAEPGTEPDPRAPADVRREVPDLRPQALHLRLHAQAGLVVRRHQARVPDLGEMPQARHQEHRLPQGHPVRPVHGPLRPRRGLRRGGRRLPRPELHRLSFGLAVPRGDRGA